MKKTQIKTCLSFAVILLLPFTGKSATYTVLNTNDIGAGSLRQAIDDANGLGTEIIEFNIPNTDTNYDAVNGVWVISPQSDLPYLTTGNTIVDGTSQTLYQGNTNLYGPEIVIDGTNIISQCFILASSNNQIKGLIIGNFTYGVQLYASSSSQNIITECYIGIDYTGASLFSNDVGITISNGSYNNDIINNVISGNITAGIVIQNSNNNEIYGNYIGTNYLGNDTVPNATGILIDNSVNNYIGSASFSNRNIISGNSNTGITINGNINSGNYIKGNFIGTDVTGFQKLSNSFGITLTNSGNNVIGGTTSSERNIVSGNIENGILINGTGAEENKILGNYIGVDSTGLNILDNHVGIIIKTNADKNIIGGIDIDARNIISGNREIGVYIESSDSNIVIGNYIGPDATGLNPLKVNDTLYQANGIELNTVAKYNVIGGYTAAERNIISGNRVYGMIYYGQTSENYLVGNYIGTDVTGNNAMPNATGICVDASSNHNYIYENVLSGNFSYGIFLVTNGTYYNEVKRNMIGTNATGTDTVPNAVGLLLAGGARYNIIGGSSFTDANVISGNRYEGIEIADNLTYYNEISYNYVGTDPSGTIAIPNLNGIGLSALPKHNTIDNNIISGNTEIGMILYEYADSNIVTNNLIGTASDGVSDLGNGLSGIVIGAGASNNFIGEPGMGNIVAFNGNGGVVVMDAISTGNKISANSIFQNELMGGIDIFPPGVNNNDAGDTDTGPNNLMNFPVVTNSICDSASGHSTVFGTLDTQNPENCIVEIFIADPDANGYGEGKIYIGNAIPDNSGNWSNVFTGIISGDEITSTATDENGNTSEFSLNLTTIVNVKNLDTRNKNIYVYPNPSPGQFTVTGDNIQSIEIIDITGETIKQYIIVNKEFTIDLTTESKGIYFAKISSSKGIVFKKLIVH